MYLFGYVVLDFRYVCIYLDIVVICRNYIYLGLLTLFKILLKLEFIRISLKKMVLDLHFTFDVHNIFQNSKWYW